MIPPIQQNIPIEMVPRLAVVETSIARRVIQVAFRSFLILAAIAVLASLAVTITVAAVRFARNFMPQPPVLGPEPDPLDEPEVVPVHFARRNFTPFAGGVGGPPMNLREVLEAWFSGRDVPNASSTYARLLRRLSREQKEQLATWLARLTEMGLPHVADSFCNVPPGVRNCVDQILRSAANDGPFREFVMIQVAEGLGRCVDRIACSLTHIEIYWCVQFNHLSDPDLAKLLLGVRKIEVLGEFIQARIKELDRQKRHDVRLERIRQRLVPPEDPDLLREWHEEELYGEAVEVRLFFLAHLKERLSLPITAGEMRFEGCARTERKHLDVAFDYVDSMTRSREAQLNILIASERWVDHLMQKDDVARALEPVQKKLDDLDPDSPTYFDELEEARARKEELLRDATARYARI